MERWIKEIETLRSTVCLFRFSIVTIIFIAKYDFYEITKTSTNFT